MSKLVRNIAIIAGAIGAIKSIEQANNHNRRIYELVQENQSMKQDLFNMKRELNNAEWEAKRVRADVNWISKMRKMDEEHMSKRISKLDNKVFKLELDNIELKSEKRVKEKTALTAVK